MPFDPDGATVRQVLAMRSGFPLDPIRAVWDSAAEDLDRSWTVADSIARPSLLARARTAQPEPSLRCGAKPHDWSG